MLLCYSVLFSVRISFFSRMSKGIFWQVHPSMQRRMTTWRLAAKASHGRPASSRRSSGLKHIIPLQSTHHNLTAFQEGFRIVSAILSTTVHTQYTRSGNSGERYKCPGGTSDSPPRASALPAPSLRDGWASPPPPPSTFLRAPHSPPTVVGGGWCHPIIPHAILSPSHAAGVPRRTAGVSHAVRDVPHGSRVLPLPMPRPAGGGAPPPWLVFPRWRTCWKRTWWCRHRLGNGRPPARAVRAPVCRGGVPWQRNGGGCGGDASAHGRTLRRQRAGPGRRGGRHRQPWLRAGRPPAGSGCGGCLY